MSEDAEDFRLRGIVGVVRKSTVVVLLLVLEFKPRRPRAASAAASFITSGEIK